MIAPSSFMISVDDHSSKNQPVGSKIVDYHLDERLDWVADLEVRASAVHRSQSAVDRIIHDELIMRMAAIRCLITALLDGQSAALSAFRPNLSRENLR